ncbi:MAG TPA: flavodoxin family protein [Candidatus Brocadiia bacterium]|nr:flavodoxin family protein [Candidatus Brocadiia bacterium]
MKVIGIVGSPRQGANTERLVKRVLAGAEKAGAETKLFHLARMNIKGCVSCFHCRGREGCALQDDMQTLYAEIQSANGIVIGSPVYMWQMSGQTKLFVDRLYALMNNDFSSRLKGRKNLALAFTQGNPDPGAFASYYEHTMKVMGFLGYTPKGVIVAAGTREKDAVEKQAAVMAQAEEMGKALATQEGGDSGGPDLSGLSGPSGGAALGVSGAAAWPASASARGPRTCPRRG